MTKKRGNMQEETLKAQYYSMKRSVLQFYKLQGDSQSLYSQGYIYSVAKGCYPYFDDDEEAKLFSDFYDVDKEFIENVLYVIQEKEDTHEKCFYYDLEKQTGGKSIRSKLIVFLRYCFLSNQFSSDFYTILLSDYPIEAEVINKDFNDEEIKL